jgi:hypothetical protein
MDSAVFGKRFHLRSPPYPKPHDAFGLRIRVLSPGANWVVQIRVSWVTASPCRFPRPERMPLADPHISFPSDEKPPRNVRSECPVSWRNAPVSASGDDVVATGSRQQSAVRDWTGQWVTVDSADETVRRQADHQLGDRILFPRRTCQRPAGKPSRLHASKGLAAWRVLRGSAAAWLHGCAATCWSRVNGGLCCRLPLGNHVW